jgi:hypothetical protein
MDKNDGGPAMPFQPLGQDGLPEYSATPGMTMRQYYAAAALQGLCANTGSFGLENGPGELAMRAHAVADAMIAEESK